MDEDLAHGLHSCDDGDDFEEQLSFQMLAVVSNEVEREPLGRSKIGGSKPGTEYVFCDRELHHGLLFQDYFSENPTFGNVKFHRQFTMRRDLFVRIMDVVSSYDPWFLQRLEALERLELSTL